MKTIELTIKNIVKNKVEEIDFNKFNLLTFRNIYAYINDLHFEEFQKLIENYYIEINKKFTVYKMSLEEYLQYEDDLEEKGEYTEENYMSDVADKLKEITREFTK